MTRARWPTFDSTQDSAIGYSSGSLAELLERAGEQVLRDLEVLVLDCQASGATPDHGDLLELGWGFVGPAGLRGVEAHWIRPKTNRPIPTPVRRLLGWSAWLAMIEQLERAGVVQWSDLDAFLARPVPRGVEPVFPYPPDKRRALPADPGVYRFLRSNGDVLYVGKAASIKKRVASHFVRRGKKDDALEMLTQVADVAVTTTETALDAAILEVDEIQRLDPPYNVHLRVAERRAWFASRDYTDVIEAPDGLHRIGPLPSRGAVAGLAAMTRLLAGDEPTAELRAAAVGASEAFAPDRPMFEEACRSGWLSRACGLGHAG